MMGFNHGQGESWNIMTSTGKKVSLLCEEQAETPRTPPTNHSYPSPSSYNSPTPPPSPGHHRQYAPIRADSISSACSSTSSLSTVSSQDLYLPATPPSLPPFDKIVSAHVSAHERNDYLFPNYSLSSAYAHKTDPSMISSSTRSDSPSMPPSPKTTAVAPQLIKRPARRYQCQCGKSFTTSGHLARHTRIHTGEKNYVCPEPMCGARFSRQDNCMQHFRTHSNTGAWKSRAKRRRSSVDETTPKAEEFTRIEVSVVKREPVRHEDSHHNNIFLHQGAELPPYSYANTYHPNVRSQPRHSIAAPATMPPNSSGLAALASVACDRGDYRERYYRNDNSDYHSNQRRQYMKEISDRSLD